MPFQRPSLADLVTRIRSDFKSRLSIAGALVRRAMANVLAVVWAGIAHMFHGHLEWLSRQLFADTSERPFLIRQTSMYGLSPTPATFATGAVTATGVNASVIPVDTVLVRDDGATYSVTAEATIAGGTATVSVQADEAGLAGNMDAADTLAFESPIAGVDSTVTVDAPGITNGNDEEDTESLRERFFLRLQEPPQGGTEADYIAWTLAVAGVTRAFVYAHENGLGTVVVRFVRDNDASIFPDATEVQAVQDALDAQRPITAEVTAAAPTQLDVDLTLEITPDNATTRAAVEAELEDLFFRVAEPGDGAGRGTILLSDIETAVRIAEGVTDRVVVSPAADVVPALGQLAVLGTITWN